MCRFCLLQEPLRPFRKSLNYKEISDNPIKMSLKYKDALPSFSAPPDGKLTAEMLDAYKEVGVLILESFVSAEECENLRQRALQLVDDFDPG